MKRIPKRTVPFSLRENRDSPCPEGGGETRRSVGDSMQVLAEQLRHAVAIVVWAVRKETCVVSVLNWGLHWPPTKKRLRRDEILLDPCLLGCGPSQRRQTRASQPGRLPGRVDSSQAILARFPARQRWVPEAPGRPGVSDRLSAVGPQVRLTATTRSPVQVPTGVGGGWCATKAGLPPKIIAIADLNGGTAETIWTVGSGRP